VRRRWLGMVIVVTLVSTLGWLVFGRKSNSVAGSAPTPTGTSWVIVVPGSATPSPGLPGSTVTPSPYPSGFLRLPSGSAAPRTGSPTCTANPPHEIDGASVVPGRTSAAVTFYNPGGSELVEYRITAISQDLVAGQQRDVGWTVVTPGSGCGFLTATVSGLDPKTRYVFSVDAVTTRIGKDGTQAATVARSTVVRTT
jgi:hypothetical protein